MTGALGAHARCVRAIFADYDGTLCSTLAAREHGLGRKRIPPELSAVLHEISKTIPVCIITSKDCHYVEETRSFSKVISCIMGIETLGFASGAGMRSLPIDKRLFAGESKLEACSVTMERISQKFESRPELNGILVERKYTFDKAFLAGVTLDWRECLKWSERRETVYQTISSEIPEHGATADLYVQKYEFHPFVDLYAAKCGKDYAFDVVLSMIGSPGPNGTGTPIESKDVLYLGDSENDNPAFRKSGMSVGVRSDDRINPRLDCQHYVSFEDLTGFLSRLNENQMRFDEKLIRPIH